MSRQTTRARPFALRAVVALLANLLSASPALANDPVRADQHFRRGLAAAEAGKMGMAALEFERAYDQAPHFSVLYNLGLVYGALGRNADAVRVLRRYLSEGGESVQASRREEVQRIVRERSVGLARVNLRISPADATVMLDARTLDPAELSAPADVEPGRHVLSVQRGGYAARVHAFEVAPGEALDLNIELDELGHTARLPKMVALFVACPIPDVKLSIDGEATVMPPPESPRIVTSGPHRVRFARPGYGVDERNVDVGDGARIECRMRPLAPLLPSVAATLHVTAPAGARVLVDGAAFAGGAVPVGRHRVVVVHDDYLTWQRVIELPKGSTTRLAPDLVETAEHRRRRRALDTSRTWGVVGGAAGLGLIATGAVLYAINGERYEEWQTDNAAFARNQSASSSQLKRQSADLQDRATSIQRLDDIALGVGALGIVSLGAGVALYLSEPLADGEERSLQAELGPRGVALRGSW